MARKGRFSCYGMGRVHIGLNNLRSQSDFKLMFASLLDSLLINAIENLSFSEAQLGNGSVSKLRSGLLRGRDVLPCHEYLGFKVVELSQEFRVNVSPKELGQEVRRLGEYWATLLEVGSPSSKSYQELVEPIRVLENSVT